MIKFAILGAGTWGTALGNMLINMGHQVSIWSPDTNEVESLNKNRVHKHLPGAIINKDIVFSSDLKNVVEKSNTSNTLVEQSVEKINDEDSANTESVEKLTKTLQG